MVAVALPFLVGCAARTASESYLRDGVNLGYIKTLAVLPFENHSGSEYAGTRSRELTITQVLAYGLFDVVDRRQVDSVLAAEALAPGAPIENATLRRLGQRLGVQGFLMGSLDFAGESRSGNASFPEISLNLKLVDSEAGLVLWQASGRGSGYSLSERLFGTSPKDSFQVTLELIRTLLQTLGGVREGGG